MIPTVSSAMAELEAKKAQRKPPLGSDQVAAVNLMALGPDVLQMLKLSRRGAPIPGELAERAYPGGILPPGDVVPLAHHTPAKFDILDPAMSPRGESSFYTDPLAPTPPPGNRTIEGAVPGMYNVDTDPEQVIAGLQMQHIQRQQAAGVEPAPLAPDELKAATDAELRRRGYTGPYSPRKGEGYALTPVDLRGAAPNIEGMRANLDLPSGASAPEVEFAPRSSVAVVNAETQPGAAYFAARYPLYSQDPNAAAMLHADYEKLLRNPDGSSAVAQRLGVDDTQVRQAQGVYKGQTNPVAAVRVPLLRKPQIGPEMDAEMIAEQGSLSPIDRARLNAVALTEGKLRDQDAVAWTYPVYMAREQDLAETGLPWDAVNSAIFRSPLLRQKEVAMAGRALDAPLPPQVKATVQFGDTWEDLIAVTEPADGSGGVMFTNVGGLNHKVFQDKVRELRKQFPTWETHRGMKTEWGRADSDFFMNGDFDKNIDALPDDLRDKVVETYNTFRPYTEQINTYHDALRMRSQETQKMRIPSRVGIRP